MQLADIRQIGEHDCGHAIVKMACQAFSVEVPEDLSNEVQGMSPDTLEAVLRRVGFQVLSGNLTVDDLKYFSANRIVACPIFTGHWVAVTKVYRGFIYVQDPFSGPGFHSRAWWDERWVDQSKSGITYTNYGVIAWRDNG